MSLSPDVLFHTGGLEVFTRMDENLAELDIIDEFITENKDSGQEGRPRSHLPGPGSRLAGPGSQLPGPGSHLAGPGSRLPGPGSGSRLPGPPPPPAELRCGGPPRLGLDSFSSEPVLVARGTAPRTSCSFAPPFPPAPRPGEMASAPPRRGASPSGPSRRACGPSPGGPRAPAGPPPAARPCSGTEQLESLLEAPRLAVSEQPKERGMRFRYECEGRSAGSILGASSTGTTKVQPAIQIQGSIDKVKKVTVTVSLVTKDIPYRPHPHCLVGKDCPEGSGICMVSFNPHTCPQHSFANLGIQCVRRKELDASLQKRRSQNIDPFITGQSKSIEDMDMNVVRLCFQSDLEMEDGRKESLSPVVSNPIYDKKATTTSQLKITCLNINKGPCSGMTEIYMLCDKVQKDDIEIIFRCDAWEGKGEFAQTDVHRQIAIVFKTPPYRDQDISEEFPVDVVLRRVSDRMDSEPVRFTYLPPNPDPYEVKRKRKIKNDISMAEQSCAAGSSSSSSHSAAMELSSPYTFPGFPPVPDGMGGELPATAARPDPSALGDTAYGDHQDMDLLAQSYGLTDEELLSQLLETPNFQALLYDPGLNLDPDAAPPGNYGNMEGMSNNGGGGGGGGFGAYGQDFTQYSDLSFSHMVSESQPDPAAQGPDPPQGPGACQVEVKTEVDL
ncbi:transcription factor RelB [Gadus chalcogrammus]|uniref:transcription factor RelB n=1 Tax=Gadus chalcogrammus TaxID=1042646 RepID=UPI0024C4BBB8|nr:transcription factor RelB [Gadus chalcogrammus]